MKKITTLMVCLLFASSFSFGQYYYFGGGTGNPGNLNTDDEFSNTWGADGWTSILGPAITTPTWSTNQTLPFAFNFNGNPVTQYKISSTGVLTFTTAAVAVPSATNAALPSANIPDASICIWGIEASGANDEVVIKTFGTAPNRQQWIYLVSNTLGGAGWIYMSIVLEETSDRIYIVEQRNNSNTGTITAGIQIDGTTAVSLAGSPLYTPLVGDSDAFTDNIYYEFINGVQPAVDVELAALTNLSYAAAGNLTITGTLRNLGANSITGLTLTWDDGSGPQNDNLTGLNIASGSAYNFSHAIPLAVVSGANYTLNVDATITGDADVSNNSDAISFVGLTSIPVKTVVGEEKTGTWCPWCPRGTVGMATMEAQGDFIGIAVHNNDPMTIPAYDGSIGTYVPGGYPGGGVDRVIDTDPGAGAFLSAHNTRKTAIVPCSVKDITATYNSVTNMVSVSAEAEFFGNISGNYRLSCVIVQDDLISTASQWPQANNYAGGGNGPMAMPNGGYDFGGTTSPSSVAAANFGGYDHVARSLSNNDILGDVGSLPTGMVAQGVHNYAFADVNTTSFPGAGDAPFVREKAHAVVMIIDVSTGEILNASKANIDAPVSVENVNSAKFDLKVFPNPTNEVSTIAFNLDESATVSMEIYNHVGSLVYTENAKTMNAGSQKVVFNGNELSGGIYFVNLKIGEQIITQKISLIK